MASIQKYKTATGTAWRVQYRDPAQKLRTKQGFKAKVQAQAWAAENTTALNSGAWVDPTAGNITVAVIAETWLAGKRHLKPQSLRTYEQRLETRVLPDWGGHAGSLRSARRRCKPG